MEITKNALLWRSTDVKNIKFGIPDIWMDVPNRTKGFLKILIFLRNMSVQSPILAIFSHFPPFFQLRNPVLRQKMKISKNPLVRFGTSIHISGIPNLMFLTSVDLQSKAFLVISI
jgi:hypothetical protein